MYDLIFEHSLLFYIFMKNLDNVQNLILHMKRTKI